MDWRDDPAYGVEEVPVVDCRKIELASKLLNRMERDPFATGKALKLAARWLQAEQSGDNSVFVTHKNVLQELCYAFVILTRKCPKTESSDSVVDGQATEKLAKKVFRG